MTDEFLQWMEDEYSYYADRENMLRAPGYAPVWRQAFWMKLVFQMAIETYKQSVREKEKQVNDNLE